MRADEILATIVEFSTAVAGFSGIVAALAPTHPWRWPFVAKTLFTALLFSAAASASISVLAMVLLASPASPATTWTTVSSVHAAFLLVVIAIRIRQGRRSGARIPAYGFLGFGLNLGIALAQVANALKFKVAWLSVASLALYAVMGFVYFMLLVISIWEMSAAGQQGVEPDVE